MIKKEEIARIRREVEAIILQEMHWLHRVFEELCDDNLSEDSRRFLAISMLPIAERMNRIEYRKTVNLRKILFNSRQKKKMPEWIFEFEKYKTTSLERCVAERLRADLPKKIMSKFRGVC